MPDTTTRVTACINEKIRPIERGERYETPFAEALQSNGYGECDGGGTMTSKEGEILFADVEMALVNLKDGLPFVTRFLEERGAPKGSKLQIVLGDTKKEIPFGQIEGLGVYLDGVNLPDNVYRECDSNVVWEEIDKSLGAEGRIRDFWQGPTETAFYLYGKSAERMRQLIGDFLQSYPLCHGARVVRIAPKED